MNLRPSGYEPDELPAAPLRDIKMFVSNQILWKLGAGDRGRTGTGLLPRDFKSRASANSATPAWVMGQSGKNGTETGQACRRCLIFGSKGGARTLNLSVNSRVLCH